VRPARQSLWRWSGCCWSPTCISDLGPPQGGTARPIVGRYTPHIFWWKLFYCQPSYSLQLVFDTITRWRECSHRTETPTYEFEEHDADSSDLQRSQGKGVLCRFPRLQGRLGTPVRARPPLIHAGIEGSLCAPSVRTSWRLQSRCGDTD